MEFKICPSCEVKYFSPVKYFTKNKKTKDGLCVYCKTCANKQYHYYANLKKKPLETKECAYSKCSITFQTRSKKKYCCEKHRDLAFYENKDKLQLLSRQNAIRKIKRKKAITPKGGKLWSKDDVSFALNSRLDGLSWVQIAKHLGRSQDACSKKIFPLLKNYFIKK